MTPRGPIGREQAGSPASHPDGALGGCPFSSSGHPHRAPTPGSAFPAALHEVGSPATVASLPAGAPAGSTTQAEGITACAFSIATVIVASAGPSGGDLASA
jgi:hypothetical protein